MPIKKSNSYIFLIFFHYSIYRYYYEKDPKVSGRDCCFAESEISMWYKNNSQCVEWYKSRFAQDNCIISTCTRCYQWHNLLVTIIHLPFSIGTLCLCLFMVSIDSRIFIRLFISFFSETSDSITNGTRSNRSLLYYNVNNRRAVPILSADLPFN